MKRDLLLLALLPFILLVMVQAQTTSSLTPRDPGVRGDTPGAGGPIAKLTSNQREYFNSGQVAFDEIETVSDGLGPRFNAESCGQCHAHPATGGTSPFDNPQIDAGHDANATNAIPFFITPNGPVREARFPSDGGVHALFTITGRSDAGSCSTAQEDFNRAASNNNLVFRIPTPVFGLGLIEAIRQSDLYANLRSNSSIKQAAGISGHLNTSGNDGQVTRFGWKAQNPSMFVFASEAYNVEQGVTNEGFPNERDQTASCQLNQVPEDMTNFDGASTSVIGDAQGFTDFMRFLDQPKPAPQTTSTTNGFKVFNSTGCQLCHTVSFKTPTIRVAALSNITVRLFSDLAVHHMGTRLADRISQGKAGGDEFRTAPLWGVGQRIFFLHDGRTTDLLQAIQAHSSSGSEANTVVQRFNNLGAQDQQDLLNFLRSL